MEGRSACSHRCALGCLCRRNRVAGSDMKVEHRNETFPFVTSTFWPDSEVQSMPTALGCQCWYLTHPLVKSLFLTPNLTSSVPFSQVHEESSRMQNSQAFTVTDTHLCIHISQSCKSRMWFFHLYHSIPVSSGPSFWPPITDTAFSLTRHIVSMRSRTAGSEWFILPPNRKKTEICPLLTSLSSSYVALQPGGVFLQAHQLALAGGIICGYYFIALLPLWCGELILQVIYVSQSTQKWSLHTGEELFCICDILLSPSTAPCTELHTHRRSKELCVH